MRKVHYVKAPFSKRVVAYILDNIIVATPFIMLDIPTLFFDYPPIPREVLVLIQQVALLLYFVVLEGTGTNSTIAKGWLGLRVIKTKGREMDLTTSLSRYLAKSLIWVTLMHGYLRLLVPGVNQAIQDEFAECLVVEEID